MRLLLHRGRPAPLEASFRNGACHHSRVSRHCCEQRHRRRRQQMCTHLAAPAEMSQRRPAFSHKTVDHPRSAQCFLSEAAPVCCNLWLCRYGGERDSGLADKVIKYAIALPALLRGMRLLGTKRTLRASTMVLLRPATRPEHVALRTAEERHARLGARA